MARCPECNSEDLRENEQHPYIHTKEYRCNRCGRKFIEAIRIENIIRKKYPHIRAEMLNEKQKEKLAYVFRRDHENYMKRKENMNGEINETKLKG